MDYMRISGTGPSSVILSQKKGSSFKNWKAMSKKCQKQAEAKRNGVINSQNYNFNYFESENVDALNTLRINQSRP